MGIDKAKTYRVQCDECDEAKVWPTVKYFQAMDKEEVISLSRKAGWTVNTEGPLTEDQGHAHTPGPIEICRSEYRSRYNLWAQGKTDRILVGAMFYLPDTPIRQIEALSNARRAVAAWETAAERDALKEVNAELLVALAGLLDNNPDMLPSTILRGMIVCRHCGRMWREKDAPKDASQCNSRKDCPGFIAHAALAKATGKREKA